MSELSDKPLGMLRGPVLGAPPEARFELRLVHPDPALEQPPCALALIIEEGSQRCGVVFQDADNIDQLIAMLTDGRAKIWGPK